MNNTIIWIALGLFIISLGLYIFSYFKNFIVTKNIFLLLLIPLAATSYTLLLLKRLPDSFHIGLITLLTSFFSELTITFYLLSNRKKFIKIFHIFLFINIGLWSYLYFPTYYLYKINTVLSIVFYSLYGIIFLLICIITEKQKYFTYFSFALLMASAGLLHFCSLTTLIYTQKLYSLILFLGSSLLFASVIFYKLTTAKFKLKHSALIFLLSFVFSQIVISSASTIMIYF